MKVIETSFLSAVMTSVLIFTVQASAEDLSKQHSDKLFLNQQWLASQIYSAAFNDISPGYDDLYVIKTQDKGREIIIYCNTMYCYKNRNAVMTS